MMWFDADYPKLTEIIRIDLALHDPDESTLIGRLKTTMPKINDSGNQFDNDAIFDVSILIKDGTSVNDAISLLQRAIASLEQDPHAFSNTPDDRVDWSFLVDMMRGVSIHELQRRMDDPAYGYVDRTKWLYDKITTLEAKNAGR